MSPPQEQFAEPGRLDARSLTAGPSSPSLACGPSPSADTTPRPPPSLPSPHGWGWGWVRVGEPRARPSGRKQGLIAALASAAIMLHLALRFAVGSAPTVLGWPLDELPLIGALLV